MSGNKDSRYQRHEQKRLGEEEQERGVKPALHSLGPIENQQAGMGPGVRFFDETGTHWILQNVASGGTKILVAADDVILEALPPDILAAAPTKTYRCSSLECPNHP